MKLASEKLNIAHDEWVELLDAIEDPVFIHDENYRLRYANKAYCEIAGQNSSTMIGEPYWDYFPVGSGPMDSCKDAMGSEALHACSRGEIFLEGRTFLSKGFSKRSNDGKSIHSIHILSDITPEKKLGVHLEESNHFLQLVIENMPARIFWKSRDLIYLGCNTKFAQDAGFSCPLDLVGKTDYEMPWKNQAEAYRTDDKKTIKLGISKIDYEEEGTAPDGSNVWLRTSKLPIRDNQNVINGMLGFYEDITEIRNEHDRISLEQKQYIEKLNKAFDATIHVMSSTMELRDPYTSGHQNRVANIAEAIGRELHWSEDKIKGLRMASTIHDIGKIAVPSEILTKPYKLSEFEEKLMQEHPEHGYQLLKNIDFPWPIAQIVYQHHERIDGSGYPLGLKDDAILPEAKVIAVADTIEAMSTNRPYRTAPGLAAAMSVIKAQTGIQFDEQIANAALKLFEGKSSIESAL